MIILIRLLLLRISLLRVLRICLLLLIIASIIYFVVRPHVFSTCFLYVSWSSFSSSE